MARRSSLPGQEATNHDSEAKRFDETPFSIPDNFIQWSE